MNGFVDVMKDLDANHGIITCRTAFNKGTLIWRYKMKDFYESAIDGLGHNLINYVTNID